MHDTCRPMKALNLLRVVAHKDWRADCATAQIVPFSCPFEVGLWWIMVVLFTVPLGNQSSSLLTVCRMRRCALVLEYSIRMSPGASLHAEAGELPLEIQRQQLCLQYICKLRSNPSNPAFNSVGLFGTSFRRLFEDRPNAIPTIGIRLSHCLYSSMVFTMAVKFYLSWAFFVICVFHAMFSSVNLS